MDVEEFFQLFFSDEGIGFAKDFHTKCGDDGVSSPLVLSCANTLPLAGATEWTWQNAKSGHLKLSLNLPILNLSCFGIRIGFCKPVLRFRFNSNSDFLCFQIFGVRSGPSIDILDMHGTSRSDIRSIFILVRRASKT